MEIGPRRGQVGAVVCEDLLDQVGVSPRSLKGRVFAPSGRLDAGQATRKKDQAQEVKKQLGAGRGWATAHLSLRGLEGDLKQRQIRRAAAVGLGLTSEQRPIDRGCPGGSEGAEM